jgi:hypothetical protein
MIVARRLGWLFVAVASCSASVARRLLRYLLRLRRHHSTPTTKLYYQYEVVQSVTIPGGTVAPAFGGGGGGAQYQFGTSIQDLLDSGVLKQVGP